jgi:hypothetical protein
MAFEEEWREYRRLRRTVWLILAALLPVWMVLTLLLMIPSPEGVLTYLPSVFALVVPAWAYLRFVFWPCPRCHRPFHVDWPRTRLFNRRCLHCGLKRYCDDPGADN